MQSTQLRLRVANPPKALKHMKKPLLQLDSRAKALARPFGTGSVRLNANADSSADLFIYGEIGGWWDGVNAEDVVKELAATDVETLNVRINSPGGSVFDGVAIYNALAVHKATVNVHIEGIAASIASVIAMAGDNIEIAEAASVMIHKPWSFAMGDAETMRKEADVLDSLEGGLVDIYVARSGKTADDIKTLLAAETWYRGKEAVDAGFADSMKPAKTKKAPKSDLLALYAHTPDDMKDERPVAAVREFERLLREGEQVPNAFAKRLASLASRIFSPARDEQAAAPREEDGTAVVKQLVELAATLRNSSKDM